jgi:cobalt-zinc-cadmium resistance protein CzcA
MSRRFVVALVLTLVSGISSRASAQTTLTFQQVLTMARGRLTGAQVRFRDNPVLDVASGPRKLDSVTLRIVYDQSALVRSALGGVGRAVLLGAVFVVIVLFGLLGNFRAALIVTLTIPVSIALAGVVLKPRGIGINTMTLGGLAIAVGLLVDAAIIVTENVVHRLTTHRDEDHHSVVQRAAVEVGRPIAFATLIIIAVFVPLFGMSGIEGRMYRSLAAAVIAAVGSALVLALTIVPLVSRAVLRPSRPDAPEDVALLRALERAYAPLLDACLRRPWLVIGVAAVIALPVIALATRLGTDFMPRLDELYLTVMKNRPTASGASERPA